MPDELTPMPDAEDQQQAPPEDAAAPPEPTAVGSQALSDALKLAFGFLTAAIIVVVALYASKCFESVGQDEVRFKLRFGRLVRTGDEWILRRETLYRRWPWDRMVSVPVHERAEELLEAFWTGNKDGTLRTERTLNPKRDGYVLTGDLNIVHLKLRVRFRASEDLGGASAYAFGVKEPEEILKRALEAATCKVVGGMGVAQVLTRQGLFTSIEDELRTRVRAFEQHSGIPLGIDPDSLRVEGVEQEKVKNPSEPGQVSKDFAAAQNAQSNRNRAIEEGKTEALEITNAARAKASQIVAAAAGYKERLVTQAQTDAEQLEKLLPAYNNAGDKELFLNRRYVSVVRDVLARSATDLVIHAQDGDASRTFVVKTPRTTSRPPAAEPAPPVGTGPAAADQ